jgi:hypothetical protein
MIAQNNSDSKMLRLWRRQLSTHFDPRKVAARAGFTALTFVDQANTSSLYVDTNDLLIVLVYEDKSRRDDRGPLRLSAYHVGRVPHGVKWGGAENSRLHKDLTLAPKRGAHGLRVDSNKHDLLALALKLDRRLSRAARHPAAPWRELRLPRLWAAFRGRHVGRLRGQGPEFELASRQQDRAASAVFCESARSIDGLTAYPLDWVSSQLESATAMFAEVTPSMQRQVCRIGDLPQGLIGFQGASEYDFYNSRFRSLTGKRRSSRVNVATRRGHVGKSNRGRLATCVA